nr:MAG: protease polymerase P70 [Crogonang virus 57]
MTEAATRNVESCVRAVTDFAARHSVILRALVRLFGIVVAIAQYRAFKLFRRVGRRVGLAHTSSGALTRLGAAATACALGGAFVAASFYCGAWTHHFAKIWCSDPTRPLSVWDSPALPPPLTPPTLSPLTPPSATGLSNSAPVPSGPSSVRPTFAAAAAAMPNARSGCDTSAPSLLPSTTSSCPNISSTPSPTPTAPSSRRHVLSGSLAGPQQSKRPSSAVNTTIPSSAGGSNLPSNASAPIKPQRNPASYKPIRTCTPSVSSRSNMPASRKLCSSPLVPTKPDPVIKSSPVYTSLERQDGRPNNSQLGPTTTPVSPCTSVMASAGTPRCNTRTTRSNGVSCAHVTPASRRPSRKTTSSAAGSAAPTVTSTTLHAAQSSPAITTPLAVTPSSTFSLPPTHYTTWVSEGLSSPSATTCSPPSPASPISPPSPAVRPPMAYCPPSNAVPGSNKPPTPAALGSSTVLGTCMSPYSDACSRANGGPPVLRRRAASL